jgi:cold shock CspA family protein
MATGTIKMLRADRGFGFVTPDEPLGRGADVYFLRASVADAGFDALAVGQRVCYAAGPDAGHPYRPALDISPLDESH